MKRFSEQLHKKSQTVKLKKSEQADLRDRIVSYMEYHPLPADMKTTAPAKKSATRASLPMEAFNTYHIPFAQFFKFGGALAAIVLVVIPFVAERAVPGDTLYAVKVNINEEVRSTLTLDPYQKVEWETTRINRRIAEAKLLKKEGRLTEEAEAEAAAAVRQHADNAKAEIATLRVSDADEAAIAEIALDSTLTVQAHSFASDTNDTDTASLATPDLIAAAIDESLEKPANQASTTLPALVNLTARVEQNTTRLRELEATLTDQVDGETATNVARRIEDIERVAAEAFALAETDEAQAREILVDVLTRTQKLIVFMTDLEVRETVAIESVVPVVLTIDEQNRNRSERQTQLQQLRAQLATVTLEDEAVQEKIDEMAARLQEQISAVELLTDYKQFMAESAAAVAIGEDALLLIEQAGMSLPTVDLADVASSTTATATSTASTSDPEVDQVADSATTTSEQSDAEGDSAEVSTTTPAGTDDSVTAETESTDDNTSSETEPTIDQPTEVLSDDTNEQTNLDE